MSPDSQNQVLLGRIYPRVLQIINLPFQKAIFRLETEIKNVPRSRALRTQIGRSVLGAEGLGLDPNTIAEIMLASTSRIVAPGLECVGPLKFGDTITTSRLDISKGRISLPSGSGNGISLDQMELEQYGIGNA